MFNSSNDRLMPRLSKMLQFPTSHLVPLSSSELYLAWQTCSLLLHVDFFFWCCIKTLISDSSHYLRTLFWRRVHAKQGLQNTRWEKLNWDPMIRPQRLHTLSCRRRIFCRGQRSVDKVVLINISVTGWAMNLNCVRWGVSDMMLPSRGTVRM